MTSEIKNTHLDLLYNEHHICPCEIEKEIQDFFKMSVKFDDDGNLYFNDTNKILSDDEIKLFLEYRNNIKLSVIK